MEELSAGGTGGQGKPNAAWHTQPVALCWLPPAGDGRRSSQRQVEEVKAWAAPRLPSLDLAVASPLLPLPHVCAGGGRRFSQRQVEEVKLVLRLLPVFATTSLYWTIYMQVCLAGSVERGVAAPGKPSNRQGAATSRQSAQTCRRCVALPGVALPGVTCSAPFMRCIPLPPASHRWAPSSWRKASRWTARCPCPAAAPFWCPLLR